MFALFPFWELHRISIAGFNYGGKLFKSEGVYLSIKYSAI
jgi:hypothetical protein